MRLVKQKGTSNCSTGGLYLGSKAKFLLVIGGVDPLAAAGQKSRSIIWCRRGIGKRNGKYARKRYGVSIWLL